MVSTDAVATVSETEKPGTDPQDHVLFIIDDDICTRCTLCVDRCPTGVIVLGKMTDPAADGDPMLATQVTDTRTVFVCNKTRAWRSLGEISSLTT